MVYPPKFLIHPPPNKNFTLPPYFLPRPLPLLCLHLIVLKLKRKSCTRKQFNCATLTPSGRTANQISVYGRASSDASPLLTVLAGEKGWGYCRYLLLLNLISPFLYLMHLYSRFRGYICRNQSCKSL